MSANNNTLVSVVMASCNGERFIAAQIDSILNQSYSNFELIICDDASEDQTQKIIENYCIQDSRIQFHVNAIRLGVNKNFEKAVSLAQGDFIAITDQDDIWKLDKLEKLLALFKSEQTVLVHGQSLRFSTTPPLDQKFYSKRNLLEGGNPAQLLYFNTVAGHNIVFRKKLLEKQSLFPEGIFYDWWLVMLALRFGKVEASPEVLTFHRNHDNNVTLGKKDEKRQTKAKAKERMLALEVFINQLALPQQANNIATPLLKKLKLLNEKRFSISLFLYLVKQSNVLFFFKKNKFPFLSTLKICYRMSWAI
jgi:glycosyltransferase involved in cell wall biosynthesis